MGGWLLLLLPLLLLRRAAALAGGGAGAAGREKDAGPAEKQQVAEMQSQAGKSTEVSGERG